MIGTARLDGLRLLPHQELTKLSTFAIFRMAGRENHPGSLRRHAGGKLLSPITVGLLGLMVAIVLWGTAYKLSLYHPHPTPIARAQVAKLWVESRASYVVPLKEIRDIPNDRSHQDALTAQSVPALVLTGVPWSADDPFRKQFYTSAFPIPSRSPPSL
jgi:hypothetical protein